jgi:hypothetical protein
MANQTRDYKPRLSIEISQSQDDELRMLVPHNMKSPMVRAMLDSLIMLLKSMPHARTQVIALIIAREFDLAQATYQAAAEAANRSATDGSTFGG